MTKDAWVFPYTLQYVDTTSYWYQLINLWKYGMGWALGLAVTMASLGILGLLGWGLLKKPTKHKIPLNLTSLLMLVIYTGSYFWVVGKFEVKFMRYMLPTYPVLMVFLVGALAWWFNWLKRLRVTFAKAALKLTALTILIPTGLWALAFLQIYQLPNTRIQASQWMAQKFPSGIKLGIEHWDDSLPVPPWHEGVVHMTLPLYERDTEAKWHDMAKKLTEVDAIVLASNRLYIPLTRLADYFPQTNRYYQLLFTEQLGFVKAVEFTVSPRLGPLVINDQAADESFTVYDHPKVIIFIKQQQLSEAQYYHLVTEETSTFPRQ
jgi:hypothetical protein